jgi:hypothetical protein
VKEHQTATGGDGAVAGAVSKQNGSDSAGDSGKIESPKKVRVNSCYENYENYDSDPINGIVDEGARWSRDGSDGEYQSPSALGAKVPAKKITSIDLSDDNNCSGKSLNRPSSRQNVLRQKQPVPVIQAEPSKKVAPKAPPIVPNLYNQKQKRVQETSRKVVEEDSEEDEDGDDLSSFKIQHHSYSGLKSQKKYNNEYDTESVSDFGNYDDDDDGYGDLLDDDDFTGLGGMGDTGMIQRTVGLLRAHKLSIAEMVEVKEYLAEDPAPCVMCADLSNPHLF